MPRAAVIGGGLMGHGIAQVLALGGLEVVVHDPVPDALQAVPGRIAANLRVLGIDVDVRVELEVDLETAVEDADWVFEAAPENLELKLKIFAQIDAALKPDAILASNTSSISITKLAAATQRADKVIGMHFFNPVPLMQLVELIRGQATSDASMSIAETLCTRLGKTGVPASDYPGFIANRILMPMINEAAFALMEGVGTADAIDSVMKLGMNHPMGPLTLADFIGLDVCVAILDVLHAGFGDPKYRACPLLRRMVAAGHLGRKTGRGFYQYV